MLGRFIALALAVETLLVCLEGAVPRCTHLLPLGGSHLSQQGLVLGLAVVAEHLLNAARKP
jgi:hypothetical protein